MTRAAAQHKTRRTLSQRSVALLCSEAKKHGMTARIVFPDGVRVELTPAPAVEQADDPAEGSFTNL